jgi:hypothetical protein
MVGEQRACATANEIRRECHKLPSNSEIPNTVKAASAPNIKGREKGLKTYRICRGRPLRCLRFRNLVVTTKTPLLSMWVETVTTKLLRDRLLRTSRLMARLLQFAWCRSWEVGIPADILGGGQPLSEKWNDDARRANRGQVLGRTVVMAAAAGTTRSGVQ